MANPLDRTWYSTLVDDNGSGTTGTIWNKAAVDSLMDAVDAALVPVVNFTGTPAANNIPFVADADSLTTSPDLKFIPNTAAPALTVVNRNGIPGLFAGNATAYVGPIIRGTGFQPALELYNAAGTRFAHIVVNEPDGVVTIYGGNPGAAVTFLNLLHATSTVALPSGRLQFPTVPNHSGDATTLDDYREGTWVPTFAGTGGQSGQAYAIQEGTYTKFGRHVHAFGRVIISTKGTINGNLQIAGLPFPARNLMLPGSCHVIGGGAWTLSVSCLGGQVTPQGTTVDLLYIPAGGGPGFVAVTPTLLQNGSDLFFEIAYQANV